MPSPSTAAWLGLAALIGACLPPPASPAPAAPGDVTPACPACSGAGSPVCGREPALNATSAFLSYCHLKRFNCLNRTNFRITLNKNCRALISSGRPKPSPSNNTLNDSLNTL